jgi:hypothetical protein
MVAQLWSEIHEPIRSVFSEVRHAEQLTIVRDPKC